MWSFLSGLGKLFGLFTDLFRAAEKEKKQSAHQQSSRDIDRDPAGEFASRFGVPSEVSGDSTSTTKTNSGKSD